MAADDDPRRLEAENKRLLARIRELTERLHGPEEIIRAIRSGEVDALVVDDPAQPRVYSLRRADLLYRAMIEEMKEAAVAIAPSGLMLYCNAYFAQLTGVDRSELVGQSLASFLVPESRGFFDGLVGVATGANRRRELALRASNGEQVPIFASMTGLSTEGGAVLCVIMTDLREQKRREALVLESERKDQFLAMLAHELRNPLAPVKHAAHILRGKVPSDPAIGWATDVIERQVSQLTRLVDDLLDVSRVTRGKISLQLEPVELALVIAGAVETAQPLIQSRSHRLNVALPAEPVYVKADTTRLTQVFANLLNNAAKFTPEGGQLDVTARVVDGQVEVTVKDSGIGIAQAMLSRIFELFAQVDTSLGRSQGGLGIGLTLSRDLVEMHGGTLVARSEGEGRGSEMVVRLSAVAKPAQPARTAPTTNGHSGPRRRVMVIDDNADAAAMLGELVETWGHEVVTVKSGTAALEQAPTFRPDLMFVDIGLPDVDGYEIARRLRHTKELEGTTLIALTGYGQDEDRRRAMEAGFDRHCLKPLNIDALENILAAIGRPGAPLH